VSEPKAVDWNKLDPEQEEHRRELLRELEQDLKISIISNPRGLERLEAISEEEWQEALRQEQEEAEETTAASVQTEDEEAEEEAEDEHPHPHILPMALDWRARMEEFSPVMKLVHLAMRKDDVDEDETRTKLLKEGRRLFEDELTMQAARGGCPGRRGLLRNGPILTELNNVYTDHAKSITNTYNYDLAAQIAQIRQDVPTANRHVYAKRLRRWDEQRAELKTPVISQMTEAVARSLAQEAFYDHNGMSGYAELMPKTAVCPVCQGWINRGHVPLNVAMGHPPPYHIRCPHFWQTRPGQRTEDECRLLWMGE